MPEDHSQHQQAVEKDEYACPMHPEIVKDEPGSCPICGMDLVKKEKESEAVQEISLSTLLKPTNEYVISSLPLVSIRYSEELMETEVVGYTEYNTSSVGVIAARVSGRIEKLYVKYRFQKVAKGQKIMDLYSPELITAQQNLLFLLKNDGENSAMIDATKQKLLLLGLTEKQVQQVVISGSPAYTITVYSSYAGHIHEASGMEDQAQTGVDASMNASSQSTDELNLKEGMYVQKGQTVLTVYDPDRSWILLNIYPQDQAFVEVGDSVRIVPETAQDKEFVAAIDYIEPFFRKGSKTIAARINFNNKVMRLPIGSQVKATVFSQVHKGMWLPKEAILSLGQDKVVFLKTLEGFKAHKIETGHMHQKLVLVTGGLQENDSVAANAQYLIDSESFVRINNK